MRRAPGPPVPFPPATTSGCGRGQSRSRTRLPTAVSLDRHSLGVVLVLLVIVLVVVVLVVVEIVVVVLVVLGLSLARVDLVDLVDVGQFLGDGNVPHGAPLVSLAPARSMIAGETRSIVSGAVPRIHPMRETIYAKSARPAPALPGRSPRPPKPGQRCWSVA